MTKAEFLRNLSKAVRIYKDRLFSHSGTESTWELILESAKKADFIINPNGIASEDKVFVAIKQITSRTDYYPEDIVLIQSFCEEAWEYYSAKHSAGVVTEIDRNPTKNTLVDLRMEGMSGD